MRVKLTFTETKNEYLLGFSDDTAFDIGFESEILPTPAVPFEGPYELSPSRETQILPTAGKMMLEAVMVKPIPPNYGLISYDGFSITVS